MNENKQFKVVRARFVPDKNHLDSLRDDVKGLIGQEGEFYYGWIIDEGMFEGVWALVPHVVEGDEENLFGHLGWIPEFDLEIL